MDSQKANQMSDNQNIKQNKVFLDVLLNSDPELLYILKKTEKITAAIYLITGAIDEREPLRYSLREQAVSFMNSLFLLKSPNQPLTQGMLLGLQNRIADIISQFELGVFSATVSEMNSRVITAQFEHVFELLEKRFQHGGSQAVSFSNDFFAVPEQLLLRPKPSPIQPIQTPTFNLKDTNSNLSQNETHKDNSNKGQNNVFYNEMSYKNDREEIKKDNDDIKDRSYIKGDRKEKIISLLKNKSNLNINDFRKVIKDCSEKTIQRELILMVNQGILKKQGERRWSTYSLA